MQYNMCLDVDIFEIWPRVLCVGLPELGISIVVYHPYFVNILMYSLQFLALTRKHGYSVNGQQPYIGRS